MSLTFAITNPGGAARPANTTQIPIYIGTAEGGDVGEVKEVGRYEDAETDLERGYLLDLIGCAFARGAASAKYMRVAGSVAGSIGTPDTGGVTGDGTIVLSGTASQRLRVAVRIVEAGALGVATFVYSLDYWQIAGIDPTWSAETLVPVGGTYAIPGTPHTLTFDDTAGDFISGDLLVVDTYPAHYTSTEVATVPDAVREPAAGDATTLVFTGEPPAGAANAGAATAATIGTAVIAAVNSLFASADFFDALYGASEASDASVVTATAALVAVPPLVSPGYGKMFATAPRPLPGRGLLALCEHDAFAALRLGAGGPEALISSDPGRTASGPIPRVVATNYDTRLQGTALHTARVSTPTTYQRRLSAGVFIHSQRLLDSAVGDFIDWQDAAIMVAALRAAHPVAWLAIREGLRQNANGTLDASEIVGLKSAVERAMGLALLEPNNARGIPGHVTAVSATPSPTTVLPAVAVDIAIRRLGYAKDLTFTLRYAGEV